MLGGWEVVFAYSMCISSMINSVKHSSPVFVSHLHIFPWKIALQSIARMFMSTSIVMAMVLWKWHWLSLLSVIDEANQLAKPPINISSHCFTSYYSRWSPYKWKTVGHYFIDITNKIKGISDVCWQLLLFICDVMATYVLGPQLFKVNCLPVRKSCISTGVVAMPAIWPFLHRASF